MIEFRTPWAWPPLTSAQRTVLLDVLVHGPRSRSQLTRRTGLSRATLSRLTRDLTAAGLLEEGGPAVASGPGRPSDVVALRADGAYFVGMNHPEPADPHRGGLTGLGGPDRHRVPGAAALLARRPERGQRARMTAR